MAKKNKFTRKKQTGGMYGHGMNPYGAAGMAGMAGMAGAPMMNPYGMTGAPMMNPYGMAGAQMMNNGYGYGGPMTGAQMMNPYGAAGMAGMAGAQMMNNGYGYGTNPYGMISSGGGRKKVYKSTKSRRPKVGGTSKTRGKPRKSRRRKN